MIEVHYVLEDETSARLHLVPKNYCGLQASVIIEHRHVGASYRESLPAQPVDATPYNQLIPQYFL
jgi:hypothetical protein